MAGANVLVAGSAVFGSEQPARTIAELRGAVVTAKQAARLLGNPWAYDASIRVPS